MQLDNGNASYCEARKVLYRDLNDGNHTLEVCTDGLEGVGCATYNWTVGKDSSFYPFLPTNNYHIRRTIEPVFFQIMCYEFLIKDH